MKSALLIACLIIFNTSLAQTTIQRDAEIENMVKEVSSDSLKSYI